MNGKSNATNAFSFWVIESLANPVNKLFVVPVVEQVSRDSPHLSNSISEIDEPQACPRKAKGMGPVAPCLQANPRWLCDNNLEPP
ncbi:MAG: hypothetical protein R3C03_00845 [Pirellulaceae bacterium]